MIRLLRRIFKHRHKFEAIRTIWPYEHGWGTHCPGCKTVVDTGLTKRRAQAAAKALNKEYR